VFYELAIRHATSLPLIQLITKGEKLPFDVAGMRTIDFDLSDPDSVAAASAEVAIQIDALEKNPSNMRTPISTALNLKGFRQSEDPVLQSLASVASAITQLRSDVSKLEARLPEPERAASSIKLAEAALSDLVNASLSRTLKKPFDIPSTLLGGPTSAQQVRDVCKKKTEEEPS
jgi:hypothetical protein